MVDVGVRPNLVGVLELDEEFRLTALISSRISSTLDFG